MRNKAISFQVQKTVQIGTTKFILYSIEKLSKELNRIIHRLPFSIKILLESLLRHENGVEVTQNDIINLASWKAKNVQKVEIPFMPARVVLQDFTGVPAVVDLAALRSAAVRLGGDPQKVNPQIPVDLVIDHSVQVDRFGTKTALAFNAEKEFERNRERYEFLKWATHTFKNFRVVPPATGIVHQVNLEYLAKVVQQQKDETGQTVLFPDTLVGTDSHTPMINGLGVLGWGVGGIEAEATMLGQPYYMLMPEVIGFKLTGKLQPGATATDLVLTVTEMLRKKGVVGKFVEFYGTGLSSLSLPDRATISNMAPEYGATVGYFPVDDETLRYLRNSGRPEELAQIVEYYCKEQGLFRTDETPDPEFTDTVELDLGNVVPSVSGPKRPQDRVSLERVKKYWYETLQAPTDKRGFAVKEEDKDKITTLTVGEQTFPLRHGSVVISAITSCTNTSNPSVMIGAGLLARNAVKLGLKTKPWVKTSLAPGSKVVTEYLHATGLMPYLEALGFHLVGYGCTTCIGNSGPLPEHISKAINENKLVTVAVLSGNRNFEGRINPDVQASFLMSPPLVVAYALAGSIDVDLMNEPIGYDPNGQPVFLKDIWPNEAEVQQLIDEYVKSEMFQRQYSDVFDGNETWNRVAVPKGDVYEWNPKSTYIQEPPFFKNVTAEIPPLKNIFGARVLAWLPDSTTTDHISPAGAISPTSPAGKYLISIGVQPKDFNSYGSRRGNHEVMMRGTLANIRIKNKLLPGIEGGYTIYQPTGEQLAMWDAAERYMKDGTPLLILAGKEYGSGSSRDWAAKGVLLQGVKAVIAETYERIHRSNLVGMGVLPLQFKPGQSVESLGLTGFETFDIIGIEENLKPGAELIVKATSKDNKVIEFRVDCRLDTPVELEYYRHGGILNAVLRKNLLN
ncbi:MAG: aconitate hydratase AcnA [candidate division KSB1 bacterium]|nr:aconitate hydratase AcnA [candidate division KSB1 bacterium]MDZ7401611.1 aconitate hydratase AcnA [candidate division KSB1 bacterium]